MRILISIFIFMFSMVVPVTLKAQAGVAGVIAGGVKKVIKAMDLKIQREQNKIIWLQAAQKTLENAMSKLKLTEISEWTDKQRLLYDEYFIELRKVKNAIATYKRTREVIELQLKLVQEYKVAWGMLGQDLNFTVKEKDEMYSIYSGILDESLKNLDQLILVSSSFSTQMSDGKRLELIDQAHRNLESNLTDIRNFNHDNFRLKAFRSQSKGEMEVLRKMNGL